MKNQSVSVTAIMVVKNGEKFMQQAIHSVLNQEIQPDEFIAVLGNSTDRTLEILNQFPAIKIIQQNGEGISNAYNTGIKKASGDLICFISHDDIWTPDKLKIQKGFMVENPGIKFSNCHVEYFLEPGYAKPTGMREMWLKKPQPAKIMETLMARKEVFILAGLYNETLRTAEDVDWFARAADMKIPSEILPRVLLKKRLHGSNISMEINSNNQNLLKALRASVKRKNAL